MGPYAVNSNEMCAWPSFELCYKEPVSLMVPGTTHKVCLVPQS